MDQQRLIKSVYDQIKELVLELTGSDGQSSVTGQQTKLTTGSSLAVPTSSLTRTRSVVSSASRGKAFLTRHREKVTVYVHAHVLKLGEIDTLQEKFHAELLINSSWREPLLDGMITNQEFPYDCSNGNWNPEIFIENSLPETEEHVIYRLLYDKQGQATVEERRLVKGKFFEWLELFEYPFDKQDLTVKLTTARCDEEVTLESHPIHSSSINVDSFSDRQQWKLQRKLKMTQSTRKDIYSSRDDQQQQVLGITCQVKRLAKFFLWNVILIMIFLGILTFSTFTVTLDKVESRLVLSFILLLSNITFKFSVNKTIPKVPYLTYLDKYILLTIGLLCFIPIWHTVANIISKRNRDLALRLDKGALVVIATAYVIFNVTFLLVGVLKRKKRRLKQS